MSNEESITMTKEQYMADIVELLKGCNKESVFQYIKSFLEKVA